MGLQSIFVRLLIRAVGVCLFLTAYIISLFDPENRNGPDEKKKQLLKEASSKAWALNRKGPPYHHFLRLGDGTKLHYISSTSTEGRSFKNLIIFQHGFPDTGLIWSRQLAVNNKSDQEGTLRLALDFPGCGGSDPLKSYGPNAVLGALTDAIEKLKARHLNTTEGSRCILAGHDWGGVLAYRIAAETEGLIDELVVVNAVYPPSAQANMKRKLRAARPYLTAWRHDPWNLGPLYKAKEVLQPVLNQFWKSKYIAMLTLPHSVLNFIPFINRSAKYLNVQLALKLAQRDAAKKDMTTAMASAYGPDESSCKTALPSGETYSNHVTARTITHPPGQWDDRIRLYQQHAADGPWTNVPHRYRPWTSDQKLKCPVSILHGVKDIAFDEQIVVDHMDDFFKPGSSSSAMLLEKCGHWNMIGDIGATALEDVFRRLKC